MEPRCWFIPSSCTAITLLLLCFNWRGQTQHVLHSPEPSKSGSACWVLDESGDNEIKLLNLVVLCLFPHVCSLDLKEHTNSVNLLVDAKHELFGLFVFSAAFCTSVISASFAVSHPSSTLHICDSVSSSHRIFVALGFFAPDSWALPSTHSQRVTVNAAFPEWWGVISNHF